MALYRVRGAAGCDRTGRPPRCAPAPAAPETASRPWRRLRCRLVVTFARLVDLVGALARPAAAGAGAVPGGVELVGNLRPACRQSGTWMPPESAAPALAPPAPKPSATGAVARAILTAAPPLEAEADLPRRTLS